jgi:hypothetical protein
MGPSEGPASIPSCARAVELVSVACRCGAIDVNGFADRQVLNEIEYLLRMG